MALMGSLICFYSATISILLNLIIAQTNNYVYHFCGTTGNFTSNSTYSTNLSQLHSSLSFNVTTSNGYQNITSGQDPDSVYGDFMCRGDVSNQFCKTCVDSAITKVTQVCVNQIESIMYFEHCMLRYSNQSFFSVVSAKPSAYQCDIVKATNTSVFNEVLGDLMNSLADEASTSNGSSSRPHLFYTKVENFNSFQKIYGLVQCTPDVTPGECGVCLKSGIRWIPTTCDGTSCYLQYDVYPFYQLPNPSPISPLPQSSKPGPSPISPLPQITKPRPRPKNKHGVLDWETRLKIIKGIAEGLLHLHESSRDSAIHRDLKPSNILLDENLNPKIADFGLAKLLDGDRNHGNTRRPAGIIGYMAPEYAMDGNYSKKSDVYAYGVVVLEIVTGVNKHSFDMEQPEYFLTSIWGVLFMSIWWVFSVTECHQYYYY